MSERRGYIQCGGYGMHRCRLGAEQMFMQTQQQSYHSADVVRFLRFLRVLLRKIAGKLLLIWDGTPIHCGQPIKEFLARGAAKWLHLEQ
jgi:phage terminase Nu1 subunit (DNA packaging protein)